MSPISPLSLDSFYTRPDGSEPSTHLLLTLLGKSNFQKWYLAMHPKLSSDPQANALIFGTWSEPSSPRSTETFSSISPSSSSPRPPTDSSPADDTPESKLYTFLHAPSLSRAAFDSYQKTAREYEQANLDVCRLIRGTLAINVIPFVRQYASAKDLYERLIYLYGPCAGIEMVGGPAVFGVIDAALQDGRWARPPSQAEMDSIGFAADGQSSTSIHHICNSTSFPRGNDKQEVLTRRLNATKPINE